uniref:BHLH domain-containing protein n=1 Tax=Ananas comosus var. bracteatus TaxID=296719 RepID=A0A6V7NWC5_ANACO|nr:unnamed protein product [Ananas comosus var. bracteatus]
MEMDPSCMGLVITDHLAELHGNGAGAASMAFCDESYAYFPHHHDQFPLQLQQQQPPFADQNSSPGLLPMLGDLAPITLPPPPAAAAAAFVGVRKRKAAAAAEADAAAETSSANSSSQPMENSLRDHQYRAIKKICSASTAAGKRGRGNSKSKKEVEKPKEVVHVRARRGHATDSHSLAERVRREKINERMRCLQELVPGCYKAMGMAGMLDEIINYVQSLQNQVEFLSMKLSAASSFYDFNVDIEPMTTLQMMNINANEAQVMEKVRELGGYGGGGCPSFFE